MPYIEVSLRDNSHKRTRRMIGMDCTENSKEVRCCRYPLSVNFEEFGWDWIIAPKQYDANYCSGECPYSFLQKYPHTHLVHLAAPQGSGGPCCAPRKMSSISMLYFDHDLNIIYGTIPGMVVESCGCSQQRWFLAPEFFLLSIWNCEDLQSMQKILKAMKFLY